MLLKIFQYKFDMKLIVLLLANPLCGLPALAMDSAPSLSSSSKQNSKESFAHSRIQNIMQNEKMLLALIDLSKQRHFSESVHFLTLYFLNQDKIKAEYDKYLGGVVNLDNLVCELFVLAGITQDKLDISKRSDTVEFKFTKEILLKLSEEPVLSLSSREKSILQKIVSEKSEYEDFRIGLDKIVESQCQLVSNNLIFDWENSISQDTIAESKYSCFGCIGPQAISK